MEKDENIFLKIQELLGNFKGSYSVLQEQVDIDVQLEYFEASKKYRKAKSNKEALSQIDDLFLTDTDSERKKQLLILLASVDEVEAFRAIEKYRNAPDPGLKDWATLALQESRILLESSFLDENKVFISTGLGGKGDKLRYFVVFIAKKGVELNDLQKRIIKNELKYVFNKYDSEIEDASYSDHYATVKAIIPLNVSLNTLFTEIIDECNELGDFLHSNVIVTNVKELTNDEINDYLIKEEQSSEADEDQD